jgi:HPt (histidine-containing phosphotransfer) domain-containing protein
MDAYVAKPIQAADLFTAIERVSFQPIGEDLGVEDAEVEGIEDPSELHRPREPVEPSGLAGGPGAPGVLHREALRRRVGDDPSLLLDLVKVFQESSRRMLEELRNGLSQRDSRAVENAAHQLKGSLGTMAATAAHDAARRLEALGRAGDLAPAQQALSLLESELARLEPELDALARDVVASAAS